MKKVNVTELINKSKLGKFSLGVFTIVFLVIIADGYGQGIYGTAVPSILADPEVGIGAPGLGLIGTYTLLGMFAGSVLFGMIGDRIGRPKALVIGLAFFCIGNGLFGLVNAEIGFIICRVVAGFGLAGVVPVALGIVGEYSPAKYKAQLTAYVTAGVPIGTVIAPLVAMAVLPEWGWRVIFLSAFIPLVLAILILIFIPDSMERMVGQGRFDKIKAVLANAAPEYQAEEGDEYETSSSQAGKTKSSLADLFKDGMARNTILFWIAFICMMFFIYGMATWLPNIMIQAGYPIENSLFFMFVYAAGSIPGIAISGILVNKIGYKKSLVIYTALSAISMMLLTLQPDATIMYVLLFLVGWGMYGATAIIYTYIALSYPNTVRSTGIGFAAGAGRLGGSVAPLVGGLLAAANAPMAFNFVFFACFIVVACISLLFTKERLAD